MSSALQELFPPPPTDRLPRVVLKPRRARPLFGRHPWVFAGSIDRVEGNPADGAEADLYSHDGEFIARGLLNSQSNIRLRLYSWEPDDRLDESFWQARIDKAVHLRQNILGWNDPEGACRLVFSEGDGLSGLIVDRYASWLVVQFTSLALAQRHAIIVPYLVERLTPTGVYLRTERGIGEAEGLRLEDGPLWGPSLQDPLCIRERGLHWQVDIREGQKTGFFLDQRENRQAIVPFVRHRRVLDAFCYSASFGVTAAVHGEAAEVLGIDISPAAIALAQANAQLNATTNVRFQTGDAFQILTRLGEAGERFGAVILDPPRFARRRSAIPQALKAYLQVNRLAVDLLAPDGILITCSCSGLISREVFDDVLAAVAEQTGRAIQILQRRGQAADHPVSTSCLETSYLKCHICRVL